MGKTNPKDPDSVEELEAQLAGARRLHEEDEHLVERAREEFFRSGTDAAAAAVESAEVDARRSKLHVERAERLLEAGRKRAAEEQHRRTVAQRDELLSQLNPDAVVKLTAPAAQREAEALLRVAEARIERQELTRGLLEKVLELRNVLERLGEYSYSPSHDSMSRFKRVAEMASKPEIVASALDLAGDDPRRAIAFDLLAES